MPVFGIFNVRTDVDAHATVHGRGCTNAVRESALKVHSGKQNPLPHLGIEPASILRLAFQLDTN